MEAWWISFEQMCEKNKREDEERRRRLEAAAEYERHVAEYHRYMAAYERYEAKAAAAAEAERDAEALSVAECAMMVKEEDEPAMVIDGELPEIVPATVLDGILSPTDAVLPQFNVVLPQFHDLGLEIVFPQISDLRFAVSPKIGNSVLSDGVLGDCGGGSAIDGAGRPPRKPPDSSFCSGDLCFLVADSWRLVLCVLIDLFQIDDLGVSEWFQLSNSRLLGDDSPQYGGDVGLGGVVLSQVGEFASGRGRRPPRQPPDFLLCGEDLCFLTGDPCKMVMVRRPPAKPPDVAVGLIPWWGQLDTAAWCKPCKRGRGLRRDMPQVSGKMLDPSPIRVGQAQAVQRRSWALLVLGLAGNKKKKTKAWRCMSGWV